MSNILFLTGLFIFILMAIVVTFIVFRDILADIKSGR